MIRHWNQLAHDIHEWGQGWYFYLERHLRRMGGRFETRKDVIVDILMARRGSYQRPFLHLSLIVLVIAGASSAPILAVSYPGSAIPNSIEEFTPPSAVLTSLDGSAGIDTKFSEKPRDQVITYTVQNGDTLGKIAEKFGVSIDTVKWANNLTRDALAIGQNLQISPVTGIVHKVRDGDTVYSIAKKYKTDAQKIVNFPFNDFADPDTFALNVGQTVIVPDGVQPEAAPIAIPQQIFMSQGNVQPGGQLLFPASGVISQNPSWYHMAFDIANPGSPGIMAADTGTVILVRYLKYDYGQHIMVDHGNGLVTLYAHLQEIYVREGDKVARGQVIGKMGSTGRSTGTHLHFEVRRNGVLQNPGGYLGLR